MLFQKRLWVAVLMLSMGIAVSSVQAQSHTVKGAEARTDVDQIGGVTADLDEFVILQAGQEILFLFDPARTDTGKSFIGSEVMPEFRGLINSENFELGDAWRSNWTTIYGSVTDCGPGFVVYRAPNRTTADVLTWSNSNGESVSIGISVHGGNAADDGDDGIPLECTAEIALDPTQWNGTNVYEVPSGGGAFKVYSPVQTSLAATKEIGGGLSVCLPGKPMNPHPKDCSAPPTTSRQKHFDAWGPYTKVGKLTITAEIKAKLAVWGFTVSIGAVFDVQVRDHMQRTLTITDCWRCHNGSPEYQGSRVKVVTTLTLEYVPTWACYIWGGCAPRYMKPQCYSNGNCPCGGR